MSRQSRAFTLDELPAARKRAFTLVELLVVIGIIAMLIGILLPALSAARKQAALVKCASNQRQLMAAALMHAQEHKGYFPIAGEIWLRYTASTNGIAEGLGDSNRQRYTYAMWPKYSTFAPVQFPAALAPYMNYKGLNYNDLEALDLQLNDPEKGVWKMFQCPATDSFTNPTTTNTQFQSALTGILNNSAPQYALGTNTDYGLNEGALAFHYYNLVQSRRLAGNVTKFAKASEMMILADSNRGTTNAYIINTPWNTFRPTLGSQGAVTLNDAYTANTTKVVPLAQFDLKRHSKKMNVAFADGHVSAVRIENGELSRVYLLPK